jgi:acylphosphatase
MDGKMTPVMVSKRVIVTGRVQGVGFRYATKDLARGFDVCGSVSNLPDGSVEILVMGEAEEVDEFLHELAEQSQVAHFIKNIHAAPIPPLENARGFVIAR